jgi:hypothetical protein
VPLVFVFVFIASISRSGGSVDKDEIANAQLNEDIRIARAEEAEAEKQKLIDQVEVAKNCTPWGPKCQRAKDDTAATEAKLAAARAVLKVRGAEHSKGMTLRLAQYVRF